MKKVLLVSMLSISGLLSLNQAVQAKPITELQPQRYMLVKKKLRDLILQESGKESVTEAKVLVPSKNAPQRCKQGDQCILVPNDRGRYTLKENYFVTGTPDPKYVGYVEGSGSTGAGLGGNKVTAVMRIKEAPKKIDYSNLMKKASSLFNQ